jgi:hypothetical protein
MCQSHYITLASSAGATIDFRTTIDDEDALSNQARLPFFSDLISVVRRLKSLLYCEFVLTFSNASRE